MLELLKRFEEDGLDDNMADGEESDVDDLAERFSAVEIGARLVLSVMILNLSQSVASASPDTLWSLLTKVEQEKFIKALHDPSSSNFAQDLLHSEEFEKETRKP